MTNTLYYGDCLDVLRELAEEHPQGIADLIYLDPPFISNWDHNLLFKSSKGHDPGIQSTAVEDTWHWGADQTEEVFLDITMRVASATK